MVVFPQDADPALLDLLEADLAGSMVRESSKLFMCGRVCRPRLSIGCAHPIDLGEKPPAVRLFLGFGARAGNLVGVGANAICTRNRHVCEICRFPEKKSTYRAICAGHLGQRLGLHEDIK